MRSARSDEIEYEIVRSPRKTADIVIERDGRVLVRVPQSISREDVAEIVENKRYWIHRNLAEWRALNAARVSREYCNGESFLYLGRSYRLRLVTDQEVPLMLKDGRFCLRRNLTEKGAVGLAQSAFRDFYTIRGRERLAQRVNYYAPQVEVVPKKLTVRDLGHRWASWSPKGNLAFNWKCMMAPLTVIDYIVVHELCHSRHQDHTRAFWNEVDKVMSNYSERREWLRIHGASLDV